MKLLAAVFTGLVILAPQAQQPYTNLQVLPKDIKQDELIAMMGGFTRALGVRCNHCHVGQPGALNYAADDKQAKRTARVMIEMVRDINARQLAALPARAEPSIKVECITCHRGTSEPRTLQDVLRTAYRAGGFDALRTRYDALRQRYYGGFAYDFGEVPLADVAVELWGAGQPGDAVRIQAMNVEMNPSSAFAKQRHASLAITHAYRTEGIEGGNARFREMADRYGTTNVGEALITEIGTRMVNAAQRDLAIAVYERGIELHPSNAALKAQLQKLRGG